MPTNSNAQAKNLLDKWTIGQTSIKYETGGRGVSTISTGVGDPGGASFGAYQLSSTKGTLIKYLNNSEYGKYADQFSGLTPGTSEFNAKWKQLADTDIKFAETQHNFIRDTHYEKVNEALASQGYSMSNRGPAIQDMVWSTSVQFGSNGSKLIKKAIIEKFPDGVAVENLTDKQIIEAVQEYKINDNDQLFASSSEQVRAGTLFRAISEKNALLHLDGLNEYAKATDQSKSFEVVVSTGDAKDAVTIKVRSVVIDSSDPMGSDDGKSIMDAAAPGSTKRADENYSHEGRSTTSSNASTPTSPIASTPKPTPGPAGDSLDADLPDGTRVVSTSITVNGQTTVTAQLLDKAGQVLLSAGAGQTMERDSDTGIVQVRTGTSDYVQQFDPATGEVSQALRTGSDAAHVYQNLLDAFSNPQSSAGEGEQLVDASGGLPEASRQATSNTFSNYLETQGVSQITQAQASALFNSLMAANNWDHLSDLGKLSALVNLFNATDKLGDAARDVGDKLPDGLGTAAGYLQLVQGLQSGDNLVIANSINSLSDHALDKAMNEAFGSNAAGEAVPYLSYALAIRNFADNPEQAMLKAGSRYLGEAANNAHLRKAA